MTGLIWFLVAIAPNDGAMSFIDEHRTQSVCETKAENLAKESRKHLKGPYSYACLPATKRKGK